MPRGGTRSASSRSASATRRERWRSTAAASRAARPASSCSRASPCSSTRPGDPRTRAHTSAVRWPSIAVPRRPTARGRRWRPSLGTTRPPSASTWTAWRRRRRTASCGWTSRSGRQSGAAGRTWRANTCGRALSSTRAMPRCARPWRCSRRVRATRGARASGSARPSSRTASTCRPGWHGGCTNGARATCSARANSSGAAFSAMRAARRARGSCMLGARWSGARRAA
mmetsp:Transcript_562/g.2134  ORF Transcript_562/g.2134 Transcript_562/m.2134 type:complete len:227 (-) Transcript_562:491-1171(-)